jgi:hypothetical protein
MLDDVPFEHGSELAANLAHAAAGAIGGETVRQTMAADAQRDAWSISSSDAAAGRHLLGGIAVVAAFGRAELRSTAYR